MIPGLGSGDGLMPTTTQTPEEPFSTSFTFDWARPPLTANQRLHWRQKAAITYTIRQAARFAFIRVPDLGRCEVRMIWHVKDKRRRDADNLVPTLKALCDGIVDAGVVADDTPDLMVKHMPEIRYDPAAVPSVFVSILQLPLVGTLTAEGTA